MSTTAPEIPTRTEASPAVTSWRLAVHEIAARALAEINQLVPTNVAHYAIEDTRRTLTHLSDRMVRESLPDPAGRDAWTVLRDVSRGLPALPDETNSHTHALPSMLAETWQERVQRGYDCAHTWRKAQGIEDDGDRITPAERIGPNLWCITVHAPDGRRHFVTFTDHTLSDWR